MPLDFMTINFLLLNRVRINETFLDCTFLLVGIPDVSAAMAGVFPQREDTNEDTQRGKVGVFGFL